MASLQDPTILAEAQRIQGIVARGDATVASSGVSGTKFILEKLQGYGGVPRSPLPPIAPEAADTLWKHPHVQELVALEKQLNA